VVTVKPLLDLAGPWLAFLASDLDEAELKRLRRHERTGRPLGGEAFLKRLEKRVRRPLRPRRPGRKPGAIQQRRGPRK